MKRTARLKRSPMKRQSAKGAKRARALAEVKKKLWQRCRGNCEVVWCGRRAADAHHVTKRSQGGGDALPNLVALCRPHHEETDRPVSRGRLHIAKWRTPPGYGFIFAQGDLARTLGPFTEE